MFATRKSLVALGLFLVFYATLLGNVAAQSQNTTGCSHMVRDLSKKIYDKNYDNFDKLIELGVLFNDADLQADTLIGLYDAMDEVHHLYDPLKAIRLYNEVEALINNNSSNISEMQLSDLDKRYSSLRYIIIDKGAGILEAGIILNNCNEENSTVQIFLNQLDESNGTLSDLTIRRMVENVRWVLPIEELTPTVGNISTHVRQNVDAMLALYNQEQITGEIEVVYVIQLSKMQQHPDYRTTVSAEKKQQVDALITGPLQLLVGGEVCLHVQLDNGTKIYIQECVSTYRVCVYASNDVSANAVLKVVIKENPLAFNFLSKRYSLRPVHINPYEPMQANGLRYDIYSSVVNGVSNDWQVQLDGNSLMIHNGTNILCSGNTMAISGNQWLSYTRPIESYAQYSKECKWSVNDCRGV